MDLQKRRVILASLLDWISEPLAGISDSIFQYAVYILQELFEIPLGYHYQLDCQTRLHSRELTFDVHDMVERGWFRKSCESGLGFLLTARVSAEEAVEKFPLSDQEVKVIKTTASLVRSMSPEKLEEFVINHFTGAYELKKKKQRNLEKDLQVVDSAAPGPWYEELDDPDVLIRAANGTPVIYRSGFTDRICITSQNLDFILEAREGWSYAIEEALTQTAYVKVMKEILEDILPLAKKYSYAYTDVPDEDHRIWAGICKKITSVLNIHDGIDAWDQIPNNKKRRIFCRESQGGAG